MYEMPHPAAPDHSGITDPLIRRELGEIARVRGLLERGLPQPPVRPNPIAIGDYQAYVTRLSMRPGPEQIQRLVERLREELPEIAVQLSAGHLVMPVVAMHPHGFAAFDEEYLAAYGPLDYRVMTAGRLTVSPFDRAYMDAIFPPEVLENAVPLPPNLSDPAVQNAFLGRFESAVQRLVQSLYPSER